MTTTPTNFKLGPLGTLNQVIVALGKTIRAMADGTIDGPLGGRLCNGLGILRQAIEQRSVEDLGERVDELADRMGAPRGNGYQSPRPMVN
jgi:hypothetical protein